MDSLFNSRQEIASSLLILLANYPDGLTSFRTALILQLATYSAQYGLDGVNLNGTYEYSLSELHARVDLVQDALVELYTRGLVVSAKTENGYLYGLTTQGKDASASLNSIYALRLAENLSHVETAIAKMSDSEILNTINNQVKRANYDG